MSTGSQTARVQAVKEELERTQNDLKETIEIKAEAEASGDQELIEEVLESETRLKGLVGELEAELARLQKPTSSADALRARLQKARTREAQARNVLSSGEGSTGSGTIESQVSATPAAAPLIPNLPPVSNVVAKPAASPRQTTPAQGTPKGSARKPLTSEQEGKLIGEFAGLGPGSSGGATPAGAFGSSSVPLNKPLDLANAHSTASQISNTTSIINNPPKSVSGYSLDDFGESAFGRPQSAKSTVKSSPTSPPLTTSFPIDSAFRSSDGSGNTRNAPKDDFGFGESSFPSAQPTLSGPPTFKQWGGGQQSAIGDHGRGVSLADSFPTNAVQRTGDAGPAAQWQAFDVPSTQGSQPLDAAFTAAGASNSRAQGFQGASSGLQGAISGGSEFGGNAFPSQTPKPANSARSGNPFADGDDSAETPQQASPYGGPATYNSWQGSLGDPRRSTDSTSDYSFPNNAARGQGFPQAQSFGGVAPTSTTFQGSLGAPQGSANYDPFGPLSAPQQQQLPGQPTSLQSFDQNAWPSSFPNSQPSTQRSQGVPDHNGRFGHPGQPFLVTPSAVVIPDADWDAAFAQAQPAPPAEPQVAAAMEEQLDLSVWDPMGEADRDRIRAFYEDRYQAQQTNGVSMESARELHSRGNVKHPMERVFALADLDQDGRLNYPEFLIYMHILRLVNAKQDAVSLPAHFTLQMASSILGIDINQLPKLVNNSLDDFAPVPAPASAAPTGNSSSLGPEQKVKTLMSRGSNQEDAKRALFLNGDDLTAATEWLDSQKSAPKDPGNIPGTLSSFPEGHRDAEVPPTVSAGTEGPKISLRIDKAILSYKKPLERPVFSVTVVNSWGDPIGESIQTLPGEFESKTGIITFGHSVVLPEGIHKIPDDACVYFELKHYKAKEKKWSTLGWTFRHKISFVKIVDSVKGVRTEAQGLNLYEKPLDLRSHFRQASMKKMRPLSSTSPDFYLRVSEA